MGVALRQVVAQTLAEAAQNDRNIIALCSDSRGSASMTGFYQQFPQQSIEVGIAEQNLVAMAAGLAACGKRPFVFSPGPFLSTRSIEQIKVDVCYSYTNVKLVGISSGVSYGALGMSHHAAQDIAMVSGIPNIRLLAPSDAKMTKKLMEQIISDDIPTYIRIGRAATPDVYEEDVQLELGKAITVKEGNDMTIIAFGEAVWRAKEAAKILEEEGISCRVVDMYCIKPMDEEAVIKAARETGHILTVEEHSVIGGLGDKVCAVTAQNSPCRVKCLGLPDAKLICGTQGELMEYYGMSPEKIAQAAKQLLV